MPNLGTGGAERVVSTLLKHLNKNKYELYLVLLKDLGDYAKDLPKDVNIILLKAERSRQSIPMLTKKLREISPDIIFSTLRGVSLIISLIRPFLPRKTRIIFREENTPSVSINAGSNSIFYRKYYETFYQKAAMVICQSNYMREDLIKEFDFPPYKTAKIYNPVDFKMIQNKLQNIDNPFTNQKKNNVIVVGRMTPQKGIDNLLNSMNKYKENIERNNVLVHILGDGELLEEYRQLASQLNLNEHINFVGRQNNPFQWMYHADLFLLPSRYEGLPNSLLEALASGCESVTTDHPGGTREIMEIVGREDCIVKELDWSSDWFETMKEPLDIENLTKHFDAQKIIEEYEKTFDSLG